MKNNRQPILSVTSKDLDIQTMRSGGPGGQHQNKTNSAVRIVHRESGAVGECREHRSQGANKKEAFRRMAASSVFKTWMNRKVAEKIEGRSIEEAVELEMAPENLRIEGKEGGKWMEIREKTPEGA